MNRIIVAVAACALVAGAAVAQTPPANPSAPSNPAVSAPGPNNPGAPAAGANSFTEGQAKARIEAQGFSAVSPLAKDKDGIWRGKATRNGQTVDVAVDYQGNVVAR
ncbi:MAG: PepSY domain-containing protein [Alphaproteobacteria bacterium]|nr:PepSY domain-containing protein [Alphaproteobacteria bacterium]